MVARASKPPATYADIEKLPEHVTGQIVFGALYTQSRPAGPHAQASSVLGMDLGSAFHRGRGGPGGSRSAAERSLGGVGGLDPRLGRWIILDEPELHFADDVVVPDLAGWRRERMPEVPSTPFFTLAPDWVCEVLSPSTSALDRGDKMKVYGRERVPWLWFVDPIGRTLEILSLDGTTYRVLDVLTDDGPARARPFDAIELELSEVFIRNSEPR